MDAHLADFQAQCVAPLATGGCPVMAAAGLSKAQPPAGSGPGVMAWRAPGGGLLVVDAYATEVCRLILPAGARTPRPKPQPGVTLSRERVAGGEALVATAAPSGQER